MSVFGDAHALAQAGGQPAHNAAVHTPAGTTVTVRLDEFEGGDAVSAARITVSDDGPGMDAELAAHAFDRFVHGAGPRRAGTASSGLGLPIVAAITAAHGGSVVLESPGRHERSRVPPTAGARPGSDETDHRAGPERDGEAESLPDDGNG